MSTVTSRRRYKRERKRFKQRRINKVAARMEIKILESLSASRSAILANAADAAVQQIRQRDVLSGNVEYGKTQYRSSTKVR